MTAGVVTPGTSSRGGAGASTKWHGAATVAGSGQTVALCTSDRIPEMHAFATQRLGTAHDAEL